MEPRLVNLPDALTVGEAAAVLRLSRNACYEAIKRKEIPAVKVGRRLLVPKVGLQRLLMASPEPGDD